MTKSRSSHPAPSSLPLASLWLSLLAACSHGGAASGPATPAPAPAPEPSAAAASTGEGGLAGASGIKIGRCTGIDGLAETKAAGFDFAELGTRNVARLSDEEFDKAVATHKEVGLPTPVANVFLPNELRVVGPEIDQAKQMEYVRKALDRIARLGVKVQVFGSGGARKIPEGFSKEEAFGQLVEFAKRIAPEAQARGIVLAVEPLRSGETNSINTAAEGLKWVKAVNHPHFQLMVDFYHLASEKEDPAILVEAKDHIRHFHIANPNGRRFPLSADEFDYSGFFANVKKMGYQGTISVEAGTRNFVEEGPKALAFLRSSLGGGAPMAASAAGGSAGATTH